MATNMTFVDFVTPVPADWLNNVNTVVNSHPPITVTSITALRAVSKITNTFVYVSGYYASGDGGGGTYYLDPSDTTSADNGGTIIVASDNGRWKLALTVPVTIRQFGAKGDGVTDDGVAINNAINWISSVGGGVVRVPTGTFVITASHSFNSINNVTLQGNGIGVSTILSATSGTFSSTMFTFNTCTHIKITGITFNVNNKPMGTLTPAFFFLSSQNCEFSDCEIAHMSVIGLGIFACTNVRALRNVIGLDVAFNSQNNGILVGSASANIWLEENNITNTNILLAGSNCWILNNTCLNYKYGGGIGVGGGTSGQNGPYYVIGNTCNNGFGIDTDGTYVAGMEFNGFGGVCANNTCTNNYGVGIASFSYGSVIVGNTCSNNGVGGSPLHNAGISGAFASITNFFANNVVSGNTCFDSGPGTQMYGYQDAGDTRCINNQFSANNFDHNVLGPVSMASDNSYDGGSYEAKLAYAGGTLPSGQSATFNLTVSRANLGDFAVGSLDSYGGPASIDAHCIGGNTVALVISNLTGSTQTLPAGNFRVKVLGHRT